MTGNFHDVQCRYPCQIHQRGTGSPRGVAHNQLILRNDSSHLFSSLNLFYFDRGIDFGLDRLCFYRLVEFLVLLGSWLVVVFLS